jgi:hypothetical protein
MTDAVHEAVRMRLFGRRGGPVMLRTRALRGGLEAEQVHLVTATLIDPPSGRRTTARFVRKAIRGPSAREATVYAQVVRRYVPQLAPELLHAEQASPSSSVLFLEALPHRRWPWHDVDVSAAVLEHVASLHTAAIRADALPQWDYESALSRAARSTLEVAWKLVRHPETAGLVRGALPLLERTVEELPRIRAILRSARTFAGVIHGDLHPGNVLHRRNGRHLEPVLVDWARARHGSALEDVSSWLHSLGAWEPQARRRHDTLLRRYLGARGLPTRLGSETRDLYWLAGASNALAGALAYHLATAAAERPVAMHGAAARCARGWLRVLRRASERLRHSRP